MSHDQLITKSARIWFSLWLTVDLRSLNPTTIPSPPLSLSPYLDYLSIHQNRSGRTEYLRSFRRRQPVRVMALSAAWTTLSGSRGLAGTLRFHWPSSSASRICDFASLPHKPPRTVRPSMARRNHTAAVCFALKKDTADSTPEEEVLPYLLAEAELELEEETEISESSAEQRLGRKKSERRTYLVAAMLSSFGFTSMAAAAVYYRFAWQMEGSEVPLTEMVGTFSLAVGAAVGMEYWARWAHRVMWHASLWHMHESHHRPRDGPLELNDVFAIINAVPAISLLAFGFFNRGLFPGLCFGAGLGITLFGMAYMFVHDGLVHRRFPVGPIAKVPYFRRVAAAHQIHHADKFKGVPYGLFLGHKELEEVGGKHELEREITRRIKVYDSSPKVHS